MPAMRHAARYLAAPRLSLLVKHRGARESLEAAGFRGQAQVGPVYTGSLEAEDLDRLLALPEVELVQLSREIAAPRPSPTVERQRVGRSALDGRLARRRSVWFG